MDRLDKLLLTALLMLANSPRGLAELCPDKIDTWLPPESVADGGSLAAVQKFAGHIPDRKKAALEKRAPLHTNPAAGLAIYGTPITDFLSGVLKRGGFVYRAPECRPLRISAEYDKSKDLRVGFSERWQGFGGERCAQATCSQTVTQWIEKSSFNNQLTEALQLDAVSSHKCEYADGSGYGGGGGRGQVPVFIAACVRNSHMKFRQVFGTDVTVWYTTEKACKDNVTFSVHANDC